MDSPDDPVRYLTLQFLAWIAEAPRTYGEAIDAWRTSCPRLPVWEDAVSNDLVRRGKGTVLRDAPVTITPKGRDFLKTMHLPPAVATGSRRLLTRR
jgi:hypothetical protein